MDPVSAIGLVGSVVGIVDVITKSVAYLSGLQSSYKIVDLKVRLLIGQLSTLKAALDQVAELINSRPDIPRDNKLVNDLSVAVSCVEAVILAVDDRLSDLQRDENRGLKPLSRVGFIWDEKTINDYLSLLNNQVNALNLFLTALQCRTIVEQTQVVEGLECQSLLRLIRDDTSSLLWFRDSESIGTCKSAAPQDFETINASFEFDTEVFASKAYRTATRSNMLHGLLSDAPPDAQKSLVDGRRRAGLWSLQGLLHEELHEEHPGKSNTELQWLYTPSARRYFPAPVPFTASSASNTWQHRVETPRGLVRPPSPDLGAIPERQGPSRTIKVLVLGTSGSGKSTLIKSLKIRYKGGFNPEERLNYIPTIYKDLWEATKPIWVAIAGKEEMVAGNDLQQMKEDETRILAACKFLKGFTANGICDQLRFEARFPEFHMSTYASSAIQTLWKEAHSHEILGGALSTSSAHKHFAKSSDRILSPRYMPTDEDTLYCRTKTSGMYETLLFHGSAAYHFFDLGGTSAERKSWIHTLGNVDAVIFTCDLSCYDTVLDEDVTLNGISEQLLLFESIATSERSTKKHIIVLFTKEDTLTPRKLSGSPFQVWFPDYDGQPESIEDILNYLIAQFRRREVERRNNAVFWRSGSLASSTTRMGEVVMNALVTMVKRGNYP